MTEDLKETWWTEIKIVTSTWYKATCTEDIYIKQVIDRKSFPRNQSTSYLLTSPSYTEWFWGPINNSHVLAVAPQTNLGKFKWIHTRSIDILKHSIDYDFPSTQPLTQISIYYLMIEKIMQRNAEEERPDVQLGKKKKKLNIIAIKGEMTTCSNRWFTAQIRSNHHSRVMEGPSKLV